MNKILSFFILITLFSTPTFADWSPWNTLGGSIIGDPAACSSRNISYVVVKGTDNAIWYRKKVFGPTAWEDWKRIPGRLTFTGSPSVTCRQSNGRDIFEVFAVVNYRHVYRNRLSSASRFIGWNRFSTAGIPVQLAVESGLASPRANSSERPHLFARGSDNKLYYSRCNRGFICLDNWGPVADNVISDPAAIFRSQNRLDFITQNSVGRLVHQSIRYGVVYNYGVIPRRASGLRARFS